MQKSIQFLCDAFSFHCIHHQNYFAPRRAIIFAPRSSLFRIHHAYHGKGCFCVVRAWFHIIPLFALAWNYNEKVACTRMHLKLHFPSQTRIKHSGRHMQKMQFISSSCIDFCLCPSAALLHPFSGINFRATRRRATRDISRTHQFARALYFLIIQNAHTQEWERGARLDESQSGSVLFPITKSHLSSRRHAAPIMIVSLCCVHLRGLKGAAGASLYDEHVSPYSRELLLLVCNAERRKCHTGIFTFILIQILDFCEINFF